MDLSHYTPGTPSWVDLTTSDGAAAARFYGELFGWDAPEGTAETGFYRMATLRGVPVAGINPQLPPGMPPAWTTYVSVSDSDAVTKAVTGAGGQVVVEPMDVMTAGRMAVYVDPTGAVIATWQPGDHPGAGIVNEAGTLCWNELNTRDTASAARFYPEVFGWEAAAQPMGDFVYTEWKLDGKTIGGMMPMNASVPEHVPSHWLSYFAVADADAAVATVKRLGGSVTVEPTDTPPGRLAVVADPQGATFAVIALAS